MQDLSTGQLIPLTPQQAVNNYQEYTEREFVLHRNGKPILVGHPDCVRVYQRPSVVAVMERKFGFKEVQSADANLQLRCYLVLVASEFPAEAYYGCLSQPRISHRPRIVHYTPADIVQARREIEAIYDACFAPDAPRRPSPDGCQFCAAQAMCPEFGSWAFAVEKVAHLPSAQWSDETWLEFLTKRPIVEKFLKERLEDAKLIKAANPERLPGWVLRPGAEVRGVADLVRAWSLLESMLTEACGKEAAKKFSSCCDISIGALEDLIYDLRKNDPAKKLSQKEVKRLVNQLLADTIEKRRNKPSLVKDE